MPRGGKRKNAGSKEGSRVYPQINSKIKTEPVRLPKPLKDMRQAIVNVDLHLQAIQRDFPWLAENLPLLLQSLQAQEVEVIRFSLAKKKRNSLSSTYRKHEIPVAATFDLTALSSDFDESTYEEIDLLQEFGDPEFTIFLTVRGESMIDAGIEPGDELVVEVINYPIQIPNSGDIVIASVDGRATVKEFRKVNNKALLVPYNDQLEELEIVEDDEFHVYGIVKKMIRSFKRRRF